MKYVYTSNVPAEEPGALGTGFIKTDQGSFLAQATTHEGRIFLQQAAAVMNREKTQPVTAPTTAQELSNYTEWLVGLAEDALTRCTEDEKPATEAKCKQGIFLKTREALQNLPPDEKEVFYSMHPKFKQILATQRQKTKRMRPGSNW